MKKIIALLAALAIACTMCISAFAETVTSNDTIPEYKFYYTSMLTVISDDSTVTFTNNGGLVVENEFALIKSNLVNNGFFACWGDTFQIGAIDADDDCSVFTNNDEMEIYLKNGTFTMSERTVLENNGVIYIAGIENYSLNGTIRNNGYIVYEEVDEDIKPLIAELKANCPNVLSVEEYEELMPVTDLPGSKSNDVMAKYIPGKEAETVYSVDVEWGAMQFTYNAASAGEWNPDNHKYENAVEAEWSAEGNYVTLTNHSNAPVAAEFSYSNTAGFEDLTGTMSVTNYTLEAGVEDDYANADSVTSTLTLSGDLPSSAESFTKVGTVTVTLTDNKIN